MAADLIRLDRLLAAVRVSSAFVRVVGWVNVSIIVGVVVNVLYLVRDPVWLKAAGDLLPTGVGIAAMLRIWWALALSVVAVLLLVVGFPQNA